MLVISDYWLTFVLGTVLPALVALVTQRCASSGLKAIVLALLAAVGGVATSIQMDGGNFDWKVALTSFIVMFVTATATHFGLLKPTGVTGTDGLIASAVPGGVGEPVAKPDPDSLEL